MFHLLWLIDEILREEVLRKLYFCWKIFLDSSSGALRGKKRIRETVEETGEGQRNNLVLMLISETFQLSLI